MEDIKVNKLKNIVPLVLFPVIIFYLFEWYTHNPFTTMKVQIQLLNIVLFELIMALLLFLSGSLKRALRCQTVIFAVIGLANYYVLEFRSAPIMPWDIFSIGTAASVANNFNYMPDKQTVLVLVLFIALFGAAGFCTLTFKKSWKIRTAGSLVFFALLWGFTAMLHQDSAISRFRLYDKLFTPTVMSKKDGTLTAFLMELKYVIVEKPDGYTKEGAAALLASYDTAAEETQTESMPNIIVIMNEAFSDPAILGDFETNEDYMPFIHSLMQEGTPDTISGYLNVSVLGGNTANTEFEFLTGNTMAFLPQGSVAYQQYVKHEDYSLATYLKEMGYDTIAMHPYNASGWERDRVYPLLGFDTFYSLKNWVNPVKIRKYVSDQSCYDKIIELYEQKDENTPFFIFNVTMQNHSSYSEEFDNFHPDITVEGTNSKLLGNYLSLIKLSDTALENLIDYFSDAAQDTIIVFFGDHQPTNSVISPVWKLNGKSADTLSEDEEALRYKVPFLIWANYDIDEESGVETSANYLAGHILEAAGLPLYDYRNFLSGLEQQFPVLTSFRTVDAQGVSAPIKEVKDLLADYMTLQYYNIFSQK